MVYTIRSKRFIAQGSLFLCLMALVSLTGAEAFAISPGVSVDGTSGPVEQVDVQGIDNGGSGVPNCQTINDQAWVNQQIVPLIAAGNIQVALQAVQHCADTGGTGGGGGGGGNPCAPRLATQDLSTNQDIVNDFDSVEPCLTVDTQDYASDLQQATGK